MKKWKILLAFLYVLVLIIGLSSYAYALSMKDDDLPLSHRLVVTLLFFGFTLLQLLIYIIIKNKIPTFQEKTSKLAYRFLQGLSIVKTLVTGFFDVYVTGGLFMIFISLLPFTIGREGLVDMVGESILHLFVLYLPWILCIGATCVIEMILLNKIFNVKGKDLLSL